MIDFYIWIMFNGCKILIFLEEFGVFYMVYVVDIIKGEQMVLDFLKISLNNKILVIVDWDIGFILMELGVILIYFVDKYGCFLFENGDECIWILEWLMWQMGGFGLMLG